MRNLREGVRSEERGARIMKIQTRSEKREARSENSKKTN
jgi:hypothetical protein